jgi:hypothetical protein
MRLPVGRPRCHVSREWPQMDEEDQRPTTTYLWDLVALTHATQARAYIEYSNELDACLCKYLLSISYSCYFISCNNTNFFWNKYFLGYLDALRVTEDHGTPRQPRTQHHVPPRQDIVDDAVSTYLLLCSGVSPPCKGDVAVQARATSTSLMPVHFS